MGQIVAILDWIRNELVLTLTALAILATTYAGVRYDFAAEAPSGVERARGAARAAAHNFEVTWSQVDARLRNRIGELGDEWVDELVVESPVALRLDHRPVPVLKANRR